MFSLQPSMLLTKPRCLGFYLRQRLKLAHMHFGEKPIHETGSGNERQSPIPEVADSGIMVVLLTFSANGVSSWWRNMLKGMLDSPI